MVASDFVTSRKHLAFMGWRHFCLSRLFHIIAGLVKEMHSITVSSLASMGDLRSGLWVTTNYKNNELMTKSHILFDGSKVIFHGER